MLYRKEIDGLRAICILPVIFYHFDLPYFNGGYIGVDIFYKIIIKLFYYLALSNKDHLKML